MLLGLFALLRPIEYLSVRWEDLALPNSHSCGLVIFVGIPQHKSQRRGPHRSHVRVDDPTVVKFLVRVSRGRNLSEPIWSGSAHTWRRRAKVLSHHFTGSEGTILSSSLRPGGASHFFEAWDENIPKLQWRGRWACTQTLEHYVQELMVHNMLMHITPPQRVRNEGLANLFPTLLDEASEDKLTPTGRTV